MNFSHFVFGNELSTDELELSKAQEYFSEEYLNRKLEAFMKVPLDDILAVIERTGQILVDPKRSYYEDCLKTLPDLLNYSSEMVKIAMSAVPSLLSRETMLKRLSSLGDHHVLDYPVYKDNGDIKRAIPAGIVCHIAAGNTFLGAIDSLLYGIVTKNINVLKLSSSDRFFPILFMKALKEADTQNILFPYIAMTYWKQSNTDIQSLVKNAADVILLFGGENAVKSFKKEVASKCEVLTFGPKVSFGVVTKDQTKEELVEAARGFARDVVFWEQRACTACQNIFVEQSENAQFFISSLYEELEKLGTQYPQSKVGIDAAIEIRKQRELALWDMFNKKGEVLEGKTANHTIIVKNSSDLSESPLERTVIVNMIERWEDILEGSIRHMRYFMSTISLASSKKQEMIDQFLRLGVMRFCEPGRMSFYSDPRLSHDGKHIVECLIKWINFENFKDKELGLDFMNENESSPIILARINAIIQEALKSPYYQEKYKNLNFPVKDFETFSQLPNLEKTDVAQMSAHHSSEAFTRKANHSYVFSAGGTTGLKKYVLYSHDEFRRSAEIFGKGFRALGINETNTVANLFPAGAFYTGFMAINKGLEETGCHILSMTGNLPYGEILEYIRTFKPDSLFSLPSLFIPLAQYAEKEDIKINVKNIVYAAEHLTNEARSYLKKVFHAEHIKSFGYAAVEIGPIGFQCEHCGDSEFHVEEEWVHLDADANGEAVVTCIYKELQPIIRYKIGDYIKFIDSSCACGRHAKKFKLLGRTGEKVRISGHSEIYFEELEKSVLQAVSDGFVIQLVLEPNGIYTNLVLQVETKEFNNSEVKDRLKKTLYKNIASLSTPKEKSMMSDFSIILLEPNALERIAKSGKVRRIIDKRL